MRLYYRDYGAGNPLIILHGLFGSGDNWHTIARRLEARGFRVIAPDLPNHGRSPHNAEFTFQAMATDVVELLDVLGIDRADVAGHSLGGKVAMELALAHPQRVGRLVILDMAPKPYNPHHAELRDAMLALDLSTISTRRDAEQELLRMVPDRSVVLFLLKNLVHDENGGWRWRLNLQGIAAHFEETGKPIRGGRTFGGPALFLRGELSNYVDDPADMDIITSLFPRARLLTVAGAGHWIHADQPERVTTAMADFLT